MNNIILATKLKNACKKANEKYNYDLQFDIKNIIVNGNKRGCSGFVTNKENGSCVYVDTEKTCCDSCTDVIAQFSEKYPNIEVEIVHNNDIPIMN